MTAARLFSYKSLLYEPNLISGILVEEVAKNSDFLGSSDRKSPNMDLGQIWQSVADLRFLLHAKFDPNQCSGSPLRGENPEKSHFNTGTFLPVIRTNFGLEDRGMVHTVRVVGR